MGRGHCIDVDNGWLIVTVGKVGVGLFAILTVTANYTKRIRKKCLECRVNDQLSSPSSINGKPHMNTVNAKRTIGISAHFITKTAALCGSGKVTAR